MPVNPASESASCTIFWRFLRPTIADGIPKDKFSPTDIWGNNKASWNKMPMFRFSGGWSNRVLPPSCIWPYVLKSVDIVPHIKDKRDDLPQPLGPITVTILPSGIFIFSFSKSI